MFASGGILVANEAAFEHCIIDASQTVLSYRDIFKAALNLIQDNASLP
jgi:hypothetical protein